MDATVSHPLAISPSSAFEPWTAASHRVAPSITTNRPHASWLSSQSSLSISPSSPTIQPSLRSRLLRSATVDLLTLYRNVNPEFQYEHSVPRRCLTKPSDGVLNNNWDNRFNDYILYVHDTLEDENGNIFTVLDLLGTGTFGQVVKCRNQQTGDIVAIKVIKNQQAYLNQAWVEISILRILHQYNHPDHTQRIVRLFSHFKFRGHLCLVFERLSINLYELLKQNGYVGLGLDLIRNFVSQILEALQVLVRSEVIHCDLKPENILVKALHTLHTTDLKLIDFGSACQLHYPIYSYVQSRFYRSPEVLLGWPNYDSQIDMWSLGCITAELFLGIPLFPGQNEMNMISRIVEMLGDMPDRFLQMCRHTNKFFNRPRLNNHLSSPRSPIHVHQLKSIQQFEQENSVTLSEWRRFFKETSLRGIIMSYSRNTAGLTAEEIPHRECLVDFLQGMLKVDPRDRWTPSEASLHPFLKGEPLPNGQPWIPPTRMRRLIRSRPVFIGNQLARTEPGSQDGMYSASAPNFNPRGPLAQVHAQWQASGVPEGTAMMNTHSGAAGTRAFIPFPSSGVYSTSTEADNTPSVVRAPVIAPGSYIPPSALSHPSGFPQLPSLTTQQRRPAGVVGVGGSYEPHSFFYPMQHDTQVQSQQNILASQNQHQGPVHGVADISTGDPATATVAHGIPTGSVHVGSSNHIPTSSDSLRMSASKDSLRVGEPFASDLPEEGMFVFYSDDEGPGGIVQSTTALSHPAQSIQQNSSLHMLHQASTHPRQGPFPQASSWASDPSVGRVSTQYGSAPNASAFHYAHASSQHSRAFQPTNQNVALPLSQAGSDINMIESHSSLVTGPWATSSHTAANDVRDQPSSSLNNVVNAGSSSLSTPRRFDETRNSRWR